MRRSEPALLPLPDKLEALLATLEATRPAIAEHSRRVATYAARLAAQYGLSAQKVETIRLGGLLHDVGKILVPQDILSKSGQLETSEWDELRLHPDMGVELVEHAGLDEGVCEIVLYHHERYDGLGYPDQLAGNAIQWGVRIVSVLDAFDALAAGRGGRHALSVDAARSMIAREAGRRFCPWVVSGLLSMPASLLQPPKAESSSTYFPDAFAGPAYIRAARHWVPQAL